MRMPLIGCVQSGYAEKREQGWHFELTGWGVTVRAMEVSVNLLHSER